MSRLLHEVRALRRRVGEVRFARDWQRYTDAPVEVHSEPWQSDAPAQFGFSEGGETTFLGAGETHLEAIADAYDTIKARNSRRERAWRAV